MDNGAINRVAALALRIFRQFTRDRRTAALIFLLPVLIMTLMSYLLKGSPTKIPFALITDSEGASIVFDVVHKSLEKEERIQLKKIGINDLDDALRSGKIRGALVVRGGGLGELMDGQAASLDVYFEGSDMMATTELGAILAQLIESLMPAIRDVVNVAGGATDAALANMKIDKHFIYGGSNFTPTDYIAPNLLVVFPFVLSFLLTSVSFLRERSSGTMERLLASPIRRIEVILGYLAGFMIFTAIQAAVVLLFIIYVLQVHYLGNIALLFVMAFLITVVGSCLGMFLSGFARTELQVAQFMPIVILPLLLVSGVFWPVETMPKWLQPFGYISPLSWGNFGMRDVMIKGFGITGIMPSLGVLSLYVIALILLAATTLRRQLD